MSPLIRMLMGLFLCGLSLACSSSGKIVEAKSETPSRTRIVSAVASNLRVPVRPEWRLGTAFTYENLTIFPVLSDQTGTRADLITLDEGLRSGKVTITEMGADGSLRTIDRRQLSSSAEVNRLALTNKSGKALVLIAGEMILGGRQDRIVGHDCIIEASDAPVPLDVFCVEHGRWSGGSGFGQSGRNVAIDQGAGKDEAIKLATIAPLARPDIREKAQAKKSQEQVWSSVAETVTVNGTSTSTGTLKSVYEDKAVNRKIEAYERALRDSLSAEGIVGVVAAIGNKVISADVFANHSLFQGYWPKMLKSYALEAVSTKSTGKAQVMKAEAEAFLARVQGTSAGNGQEGVYRLKENQSVADASFELEYTAKTPSLVHFNRVAKQ
jgi:ARG and Rhodanese-Phosphatase-superfamily-associated Protein domain